MNPQIFGTNKCQNTKKALRFFKEHGVAVHFVDLNVKAISKGELESVARTVPMEELIDKEGSVYEKMNLKYMKFDIKEKILENSLLLKTPLVRLAKDATVGFVPETWRKWIEIIRNS